MLQKPYNTAHLTLGMLLHYLGKLKIQIFCRYSAILYQIWKKMQNMYFKCVDFNSSTHVTVYTECVYVFLLKSLLNIMLIVDKH